MLVLSEIKQILTYIKPELQSRFNVKRIGLFGSVVRGEQTSNSDIDIIVDFNKPIGIEFIDLATFLENNLKTHVDLVSMNGVKAKYLQTFEAEIIYV